MHKIENGVIYKGHFTSAFSRYIMESIIQGYTEAEAYADNLENPRITVVWDGKHSVFCGGRADEETLSKAVSFIKNDLLTQQVRSISIAVKIIYENPQWKDAIIEGMNELSPKVYQRSIYRHKLLQMPYFACNDTSITIKRIDKEMLYGSKTNNIQGVIDEVSQMWGSAEKFLAKGFGHCALKDDAIAAWCTCEYLSKASCGIGIETYEQYQRQGVAAATVCKMLNYCKALGKTPYWDCWKNNIASAKTAEKAGFEKLTDYDIVFLRFE